GEDDPIFAQCGEVTGFSQGTCAAPGGECVITPFADGATTGADRALIPCLPLELCTAIDAVCTCDNTGLSVCTRERTGTIFIFECVVDGDPALAEFAQLERELAELEKSRNARVNANHKQ